MLPIVLNNGEAKWTAVTDVAELIPPVPGLVAQYLPKLSYVLIEENRYRERELAALENLLAAVIRFELWARQYEQRGKEEGRREGLAKGLQEGLQEGLEKGLQEGLQAGRQEGRQEGLQLVLQKLLTKRFGPLSAEVMERIDSGSSEQINRWVDRVLDAASLEEVFRLH